jgi:predicted nucleotidyltransferase
MAATVQVPDELLQQVVEVFEPEKVILFGSHADGGGTADRDFDLLVVVADDTPPGRLGLEARRRARQRYRRAADIIPCRQTIFEEKATVPGSFAHTIARQGVVVYERK